MIHTFKVYFPLDYEEVRDLQKRFNISYKDVNKLFEGKFRRVTIAISNRRNGKWKLYMVVDAIKLLNKTDLTDSDYSQLEKQIRFILWNILGHSSCYKEHVLLRTDYRYDVVVPNEHTRQLLLDLYKKLTRCYRFQKKHLGFLDDKGAYHPYKTTVYHSSNSVESIVYLKDEERKAKNEEPEWYEKNVIRFEVRLLESHLNYMAKKSIDPRPKKLKEYFKNDLYKEYFKRYLFSIYPQEDFYILDESRKIIRNSSLSPKNKEKLIDFLKKISSFDMDTPLKYMSKGTYKKRLKSLKELGINPIPIPKNYYRAPRRLENPLRRFPR